MYSFINQKARLEKVYVNTENLLLVILDMIAGFAPLIAFLFKESGKIIIISLMIMIGVNLFIKISVRNKIIES